MIWGDVAREPQTRRYETLSAELKLCGFEQAFVSQPLNENPLVSQWPDIEKKGYEQLRVGRDECVDILEVTNEIPRQVSQLRGADALVRENGKWVARNFFHDAIVELMAQNVKSLDFTGDVLIVGSGGEARAAAFALSQVGFKQMTIAGGDDFEVAAVINHLRRHCFGVNFSDAKTSQLTQMAATSSVAVNTLSTTGTHPLLTELSYFNFLKPDGVWVETSVESATSPLVQEARELELQTISSLEVMTHVDALWAQRCFNVKIDRNRYLTAWSAKLSVPTP